MTVKELKKTHADYTAYLPEWNFFAASYYGGKKYRDGYYLLKHPFESDANYQRRKATAYYYNYCAPVVDILTAYLYRRPPVRSYGTLSPTPVPPRIPVTLFDAFWWDVDFENSNLDQFMREVSRLAAIYGRVSVIVDKPVLEVATLAQAKDFDIRPYFSIITPANLLDWNYVRRPNGRFVLDMVKIKEDEISYRIWTRTGWELWRIGSVDKEVILVESGEHSLGEVPIVNIYNKRSGAKMLGVSDIQDIADINKNIYYLCSDAKEIIENTAFPMLALPYEKGGEGGAKELGPKNILQFDPELSNSSPFWLEAPHSSLAEIREWIQQDAQEIVRIAKMGGLRNTETSVQPWSGVSIALQTEQLKSSLVEKADNMEQAELDLLYLWCKWMGVGFGGNVEYVKDFDVQDVTRKIQDAISVVNAGIKSQTFEVERQKILITSMLPSIEESTRDIIFGEIEKNTTLRSEEKKEEEKMSLEIPRIEA